jgi:hypothetical protein
MGLSAIAVDTTPSVAATTGNAEVGQAVSTLILAFAADPAARWIYEDAHQYLRLVTEETHAKLIATRHE